MFFHSIFYRKIQYLVVEMKVKNFLQKWFLDGRYFVNYFRILMEVLSHLNASFTVLEMLAFQRAAGMCTFVWFLES